MGPRRIFMPFVDRRISGGILRRLIATHQTNQFEDRSAFRVDEIGENL